LNRLKSAFFEQMFGDPVANSKNWPRKPFAALLKEIASGWSPVCLDRPAQEGEWGVLKLSAVTTCEYDDSEQKALPPALQPKLGIEVKKGDLLFTRKNTSSLVAATALVRNTRAQLMISDLIFCLRLNETAPIIPEFLHALLTWPSKRASIQTLAGGSAGSMPNISKEKLRNVEIELPPLDLQRTFAARVAEIDKLMTAHLAHLEKLDALFAVLQQRAFRGELTGASVGKNLELA
jgi:type I restriction enzyme S subunit